MEYYPKQIFMEKVIQIKFNDQSILVQPSDWKVKDVILVESVVSLIPLKLKLILKYI